MPEDPPETSAPDSPLAAVVAGVLFLPAVYVAFFVVDDLSLLLRIAFVIVVPSTIGSTVAAIWQAATASR